MRRLLVVLALIACILLVATAARAGTHAPSPGAAPDGSVERARPAGSRAVPLEVGAAPAPAPASDGSIEWARRVEGSVHLDGPVQVVVDCTQAREVARWCGSLEPVPREGRVPRDARGAREWREPQRMHKTQKAPGTQEGAGTQEAPGTQEAHELQEAPEAQEAPEPGAPETQLPPEAETAPAAASAPAPAPAPGESTSQQPDPVEILDLSGATPSGQLLSLRGDGLLDGLLLIGGALLLAVGGVLLAAARAPYPRV